MNIIVTGASKGIGYELVKFFSTDSSNSIIAIARDSQKLNQLKKDCLIINPSSQVVSVPFDLSSENFNDLKKEITKHITKVDILINNAGITLNKPFANISSKELSDVYNTNIFSVFRLIQLVMQLFDNTQRAHVVNISSMGGFQGSAKFAGLTAYSSSKAALACLTECLAEEYKNENVSFNCLALGAVQTEMLSQAFPGYKAPISPEQMADFIGNYATSAHRFMNGKIIPVSLSTP